MNWNYKGYEITINNNGLFILNINGDKSLFTSLKDAKAYIDRLFSHKEIDDLVNKLTRKERRLLNDIANAASLSTLFESEENKFSIDMDYLIEQSSQ